jgi:hypothetical protein
MQGRLKIKESLRTVNNQADDQVKDPAQTRGHPNSMVATTDPTAGVQRTTF